MITQLCGPAFRPLQAIIVAPDAISDNWTSEENEQIVLSTYDHIVKNYNVDKKKTLLTGFSMGGHGTWYIAGRHQDLFSAAIPIAARPDQTTSDWTIPVYAIHSRGDKVIPIGPAREYITKMRKKGANMRLMYTRSIPHHQTELYASHYGILSPGWKMFGVNRHNRSVTRSSQQGLKRHLGQPQFPSFPRNGL